MIIKKEKIESLVRLHLGCGNVVLPGWTNVDMMNYPGVDLIDDVTKLTKIPNSSCDIIYASHVLEHISRHKTIQALSLWRNKLKPGGILRISVPDFSKVVKVYSEKGNIKDIIGLVNGGQRSIYDSHLMIFDKPLITEYLTTAGFSNITEWDWRKTEHSDYDDYSQAYLPHMDKENGVLMSLNIEATK